MLGPALAALQADPAASEAAGEVFQQLKPVCAQLMHLRSDPQRLTAALCALRGIIDGAQPLGLRRCFDYVMYPLLFMLDAAVAARSVSHTAAQGRPRPQPTWQVPAVQHDAAAEALLQCVLALLQHCQGLEADQLMPVLQHVGSMLQLQRGDVSEEMRLLCFKIIQAALQSQSRLPLQQQLLQHPAGHMLGGFLITTCLAAAEAEVSAGATGSKAVRQASIRTLGVVVRALGPGPQLAFALPGLASGLAKQLLASVPMTAGTSITGAAAGSTGTVLVLQTLLRVIQLTLGDQVVAHIPTADEQQHQGQPNQQQQVAGSAGPQQVTTADEALRLLQELSLQTTSSAGEAADAGTAGVVDSGKGSGSSSGGSGGNSHDHGNVNDSSSISASCPQDGPLPPLTAKQDAPWLANSSSKVQTVLAMVLPRLQSHPQPAVRQALAEVTAELLQHCGRALADSRVALTEILLTLASDDYPQVAQPAIRYFQAASSTTGTPIAAASAAGQPQASGLQLSAVAARLRKAAAGAAAGNHPAPSAAAPQAVTSSQQTAATAVQPPVAAVLPELLLSLCLQLPKAVRQSEASGIAAAKRLATALLCADSQLVSSILLSKGPVLQQVCSAMVATFAMDPTGAALLLRADTAALGDMLADDGCAPTPTATTAAGAATAAATAAAGGVSGGRAASGLPGEAAAAAAGASGSGAPAGLSAAGQPLLPRMPLSLQSLISRDSYKATAGAARALGRAARLADLQQTQSGSNLQALVQQLLEQLQAASSPHKPQTPATTRLRGAAGGSGRYSLGPTPAAGEWQCDSAAAVVVLTEVLFGASDAWQPHLAATAAPKAAAASSTAGNTAATAAGRQAGQQGHQQELGMDAGYESVLLQALAAFVRPKLWGLPTAQSLGGGPAETGKRDRIPAQVLGANALLLRCLIDGVGTVARCAGPAFSTGSSKLLRTALLPLLERLADPCPMVATAASGTLHSICRHAGYPLGLRQLVGANADYVVDGVCRQLRSLQQHPRVPQLLAALLREAGVSAALMPLLAEPLRAALSGVSIIARQQQPEYTLPFLYVLQSVAAGADQEAQHSRQVFTDQLQDAADTAMAALLLDTDDAEDASDTGMAAENDDGDGLQVQQSGSAGLSSAAEGQQRSTASDSTAARFFKQRLKQQEAMDPGQTAEPSQSAQQQQQQRSGGRAGGGAAASAERHVHEVPILPAAKKLQLPATQLEELDLIWRRAHSAGSLAAAAVDAATPLLLQRNLRCAVLAVQVLSASLRALAAATEAVDTEEQLFERLVDRGPDAALKPTRPAAAKLLPAVHGVWPMLLAALQDTGSVALLEQQLSLLALLVQLAGGKFMARRFKQTGWPLLQRLLKSGPQAGAAVLAASTAANTVGGGAAAAALLGVGGGPGSDSKALWALPDTPAASTGPGSSSSRSVFGSALSSLRASAGAHSTLNAAAGALAAGEPAVDEGGPLAPATLQRVQLAVLGCLQSICSSSSAAPAVQGPLVWDMCVLAAPFLADHQALALREAAAKLLVAAAAVDADAVWLLLLDLGCCYQDITLLLQEAGPAMDLKKTASQQELPGSAPKLPVFPKPGKLLPPVSNTMAAAEHGAGGVDGGWRKVLRSGDATSCGRRAAALLPRVAAVPVCWHQKAEQQLAVLHGTA